MASGQQGRRAVMASREGGLRRDPRLMSIDALICGHGKERGIADEADAQGGEDQLLPKRDSQAAARRFCRAAKAKKKKKKKKKTPPSRPATRP